MIVPSNPQQKFDLPKTIPLFPLPGALLLPQGQLPLNIFEPRYLRMVDDALAGARLIGMIQPVENTGQNIGAGNEGELYEVGCAGRITSFVESGDGRYLITLTGIRRFELAREVKGGAKDAAPYRVGEANWDAFEIDAHKDESAIDVDRDEFLEIMHDYLEAESLKADGDNIDDAPLDALVASLAMGCPFAPNEKQALLEAQTVAERAECLMALMEMSGGEEPGGDQVLQ
ncbi:MAG: ATP-dependent protease [Hyphococcus sp.]|nr:MAG: ATP-dependent protease [Marinicaulis sp.]